MKVTRVWLRTWIVRSGLGLGVLCTVFFASAAAPLDTTLQLEGFTEPYRVSNVATDDAGVIGEFLVRDGDEVRAGQPLARLNNDVHEALLSIAEHHMLSEGRLDGARAELVMRQERLAKLQSLRVDGHARQEEVDRAQSELGVAEANVRSAQQDLIARKLEYKKIKTQIDRRTIRAPFAGVVTTFHKERGEFVALNDAAVLTLVDLNSLLANFMVLSPQAANMNLGQEIAVHFPASGLETHGTVEFISPITDAESGTVRVKIRVDNPQRVFRSGERCKIWIRDRPSKGALIRREAVSRGQQATEAR